MIALGISILTLLLFAVDLVLYPFAKRQKKQRFNQIKELVQERADLIGKLEVVLAERVKFEESGSADLRKEG
jgi:hypothetical protein